MRSADGQRLDLQPKQIQISGQHSYPAQSQPQHQLTAQNEWQPNLQRGQNPAVVVYVKQESEPDPNAESKRTTYRVCQILQFVICFVSLVAIII